MKREIDISAVYESYIKESIEIFLDSCDQNPFDAIRSFQLCRAHWQNAVGTDESKQNVLSNLESIEALLIDIAEGQSQRNQMLLNQYEQN